LNGWRRAATRAKCASKLNREIELNIYGGLPKTIHNAAVKQLGTFDREQRDSRFGF
jgi:hypothetical protein